MNNDSNDNNFANTSNNTPSESSNSDEGSYSDTDSNRELSDQDNSEFRDANELIDSELTAELVQANGVLTTPGLLDDDSEDDSRQIWETRRDDLTQEWNNRQLGPLPFNRSPSQSVTPSENTSPLPENHEDLSISQNNSSLPEENVSLKRKFAEEIEGEDSNVNSPLSNQGEVPQPGKKPRQDSSDVNSDCEAASYGWDDSE